MAKKTTRPLPKDLSLATTLAGRVFQIREFRNMTLVDLAKDSNLTHARIQDIESGMETWLSSPVRQRLAKALNVEPVLLQEVEYRPAAHKHPELTEVPAAVYEELSEKILAGQTDLKCPRCRSELRSYVKQGIDLQEQPIHFATAHCVKCPFVL